MALKFEPGDYCWITDETERYLPAKALTGFTAGEATTVRTEDGEDHTLDSSASSNVTACSTQILSSSVEDLINISDLSEMAILHSLRIRFREDKIYTNISSIVISVNPFRLLPLFTPEVLAQYRDGNERDLPPHIFTSANAAYKGMCFYTPKNLLHLSVLYPIVTSLFVCLLFLAILTLTQTISSFIKKINKNGHQIYIYI